MGKLSTSKKMGKRKAPHGTSKEKMKAQVDPTEEASGSTSEEDDDGVNEAGMERLMKALGNDGLDDIAQHMLQSLNEEDGDDDEVSSDDQDEDEENEKQPKVHAQAEADTLSDNDGDEVEEKQEKAKGASKARTEQEEEVDLEEVSSLDEDVAPRQKVVIDNKEAMERIRDSIQLDPSLPWTETLATTYLSSHEVDVSDDLNRELSFYKQALESAEQAKELAAKHNLPFTRPSDFFAEMVKSDVHMERIRQRLLDETATIKKGEQKKREREGKKFGKQVQIERLREKEKGKKDLDEKLKSLKRKRKGGALEDEGGGEDFDIALEDAINDQPQKKARMPRTRREAKFGFGGRGSVGWRSKQNTRDSTDQPFGGKGGKGGRGGKAGGAPKRLGKSRRMAKHSKK